MRLAATVMLVRPTDGRHCEVFMLRRSAKSAFAPDAYVFPGGTIDPQDEQPAARQRTFGDDDTWLRSQFRSLDWPSFPSRIEPVSVEQAGSLVRAALRELFEEAGVLLACDAAGNEVTPAMMQGERRAVQNNDLQFAELLARENVFANARALTLFSQWITPPSEPRRYDTHFFLALGSRSHTPLADTIETHDGVWITPRDALARAGNGFHLVYPTIKHLERLAEFDDVDALLNFARNKPVYRVMPDDSTGERQFTIPAELERAW